MFGVPAPTEFDLRFRLLGVPVRVNPFFWVFAAFIGGNFESGTILVTWVACVFLSVLFHEFGHALTNVYFRAEPSVYLVAMGGLCTAEGGRTQRPWQRFAVILMGPLFNFLLAGLMLLAGAAIFRLPPGRLWQAHLAWFIAPEEFGLGHWAVACLVYINLFWGLVNLFPIMPLDGGQLAGILLTWHNVREGMRRAYIVSIVTAGLLAIYCFQRGMTWNAIFVGFLALSSFQVLQSLHYQSKYGDTFDDESEWWKR